MSDLSSDLPLISTPQAVEQLFTRASGYAFARWNRPIVPVVFGVEESTLALVKGALELVVGLAGHKMAETDFDLGANVMVFFCRDWAELRDVPNLHQLIEGFDDLVTRLQAAEANQYRMFRYDEVGGIRAAFVFLRMDAEFLEAPAEVIALDQAVRLVLPWADGALAQGSLMVDQGELVLRPDLVALMQAAYDPVMPIASTDPSHALRLFARLAR